MMFTKAILSAITTLLLNAALASALPALTSTEAAMVKGNIGASDTLVAWGTGPTANGCQLDNGVKGVFIKRELCTEKGGLGEKCPALQKYVVKQDVVVSFFQFYPLGVYMTGVIRHHLSTHYHSLTKKYLNN